MQLIISLSSNCCYFVLLFFFVFFLFFYNFLHCLRTLLETSRQTFIGYPPRYTKLFTSTSCIWLCFSKINSSSSSWKLHHPHHYFYSSNNNYSNCNNTCNGDCNKNSEMAHISICKTVTTFAVYGMNNSSRYHNGSRYQRIQCMRVRAPTWWDP